MADQTDSWSTYRIPGVNTQLVGMFDQRKRIFLIENPVLPLLTSVTHSSQDDLGDLEAGVAKTVAPMSAFVMIWLSRGFTERIPLIQTY